ncbi:hypothetical protein [Ruminococcus flavefaciens]|uniref:rRNA biogenesis protein rrp5 n=1 Tax=Ruminococcus flavefaciens 007c TaxID=1341157 RepID=W7UGD7_RUMFL|nr:hypothetical protein [Ruminococcus flavefaciens]EWM54216.1 hypothetical protein RF007C_02820 [Ruminococcus flavefaciens 007c]
MTETKKNKLPEPIPVDAKKLIDGLGTIFGGVIQLLNSMEPGMAQQLAEMAINGVPKPAAETAPETINPDEFEEILSADDLPWDTEPEEKPKDQPKKKAAAKKQEPASELTADDLIKVVTGKIKQNRANKDKVLALLKSYGAAKVSDIPQDKYEAFLTDVSQL